MRHLLGSISILGVLAGSVSFPALAQAQVNVVTSIKPVHSLVASVMEGVGTPDLVVEGAAHRTPIACAHQRPARSPMQMWCSGWDPDGELS